LPVATAEVALKDVTGPHKSSAASSNRYIKGRSAYSASTDDQAPEPGNNRRSGAFLGTGFAELPAGCDVA
jgi:hypothetical protein